MTKTDEIPKWFSWEVHQKFFEDTDEREQGVPIYSCKLCRWKETDVGVRVPDDWTLIWHHMSQYHINELVMLSLAAEFR